MSDKSPVFRAALAFLKQGLRPVPVGFQTKQPHPDWRELQIDELNATKYFGEGPSNIGLRLGAPSRGLVDVDCDCDEAVALASYFLPPTGAVFGRKSRPRSHSLFLSDLYKTEIGATIQFRDVDGKVLVELRTGGGDKAAQTVVPPSTHVSSEPIQWAPDSSGDPSEVDAAS
jgi:hypothetical protein